MSARKKPDQNFRVDQLVAVGVDEEVVRSDTSEALESLSGEMSSHVAVGDEAVFVAFLGKISLRHFCRLNNFGCLKQ